MSTRREWITNSCVYMEGGQIYVAGEVNLVETWAVQSWNRSDSLTWVSNNWMMLFPTELSTSKRVIVRGDAPSVSDIQPSGPNFWQGSSQLWNSRIYHNFSPVSLPFFALLFDSFNYFLSLLLGHLITSSRPYDRLP